MKAQYTRREVLSLSWKVGGGVAAATLLGYGAVRIFSSHGAERSPRNDLNKLVEEMEREGHINRADLLGGEVLFLSEVESPQYRLQGKELFLEAVRKSRFPYTYKKYLSPTRTSKIYVVLPDEYISYIRDPNCNLLIKAMLFHEFFHVRDRSDIEIADQAARMFTNNFTGAISSREVWAFIPLGQAVSEIMGNFSMRAFVEKERGGGQGCPLNLQEIMDQHLVNWMRNMNNALLGIQKIAPGILESIIDLSSSYVRKEWDGLSLAVRLTINQVLQEAGIPRIE